MSEWKPGTVAVHESPSGRTVIYVRGMASWHGVDQYGATYTDRPIAHPHIVVVIDPENREQVERLAIAYTLIHNYSGTPWEDREQRNRDRVIDALSGALREFANPTPPKPEEPTGLGAVVEDAEGERWVRWSLGEWPDRAPWRADGPKPDHRRWEQVNAVRVLSEGVQP